LDDRRGMSAVVRASVHVSAAGWAVWCFGGFPTLSLGTSTIPLGVAGSVLAVIGIAWLTNLYNFMDGIDGIAASEALVVGVVGGILLAAEKAPGLSLVALSLAGAVAGFLALNWPPAKIFMGDVGSGLLGYAFGVLAIASERENAVPAAVWMILLAVFIVDATATLIRRMLNGERWFEAHRSHAYQRAVQSGFSHRDVTTGVVGINMLLAAAAVAAWFIPSVLPAIFALVVVGLLGVWYWFACHRAVPQCSN